MAERPAGRPRKIEAVEVPAEQMAQEKPSTPPINPGPNDPGGDQNQPQEPVERPASEDAPANPEPPRAPQPEQAERFTYDSAPTGFGENSRLTPPHERRS